MCQVAHRQGKGMMKLFDCPYRCVGREQLGSCSRTCCRPCRAAMVHPSLVAARGWRRARARAWPPTWRAVRGTTAAPRAPLPQPRALRPESCRSLHARRSGCLQAQSTAVSSGVRASGTVPQGSDQHLQHMSAVGTPCHARGMPGDVATAATTDQGRGVRPAASVTISRTTCTD